jgi:hypothetical protein
MTSGCRRASLKPGEGLANRVTHSPQAMTSHDLMDDGTARSVSKTRCDGDVAINDHPKGLTIYGFRGFDAFRCALISVCTMARASSEVAGSVCTTRRFF